MAYDLERFVAAQDHVYDAVVAELRAGRKTGHWMWFVFPQIAGLGQSFDGEPDARTDKLLDQTGRSARQ